MAIFNLKDVKKLILLCFYVRKSRGNKCFLTWIKILGLFLIKNLDFKQLIFYNIANKYLNEICSYK